MKNFLIVTNEYKDKDLTLSRQIVTYLSERGAKAKCSLHVDLLASDVDEEVEGILVLGGDGTLIRAATRLQARKVPLLGVNLGTLGYLCEIEKARVFEALDRMLSDDYEIEDRMMLTGYSTKPEAEMVALNDIVIHRDGDLSILSINVYVNGEFLTTYHGDGMIVATPTGSTGYNMSAGGPIVDPKAKVILLTPINAHNLNSKSIVLGAEDVIELEVGSRRDEEKECAVVSFDGDQVAKLNVGDRFTVAQATNTTSICKLSNQSFLELLRKKMQTYQ